MSVEEDSRQEWTFTLYDFDNNGKVTREVSVPAWPPATAVPSGSGTFVPGLSTWPRLPLPLLLKQALLLRAAVTGVGGWGDSMETRLLGASGRLGEVSQGCPRAGEK